MLLRLLPPRQLPLCRLLLLPSLPLLLRLLVRLLRP
jgi:hypothetical protein